MTRKQRSQIDRLAEHMRRQIINKKIKGRSFFDDQDRLLDDSIVKYDFDIIEKLWKHNYYVGSAGLLIANIILLIKISSFFKVNKPRIAVERPTLNINIISSIVDTIKNGHYLDNGLDICFQSVGECLRLRALDEKMSVINGGQGPYGLMDWYYVLIATLSDDAPVNPSIQWANILDGNMENAAFAEMFFWWLFEDFDGGRLAEFGSGSGFLNYNSLRSKLPLIPNNFRRKLMKLAELYDSGDFDSFRWILHDDFRGVCAELITDKMNHLISA